VMIQGGSDKKGSSSCLFCRHCSAIGCPLIIHYRVVGNELQVLRVFHARRKLPKVWQVERGIPAVLWSRRWKIPAMTADRRFARALVTGVKQYAQVIKIGVDDWGRGDGHDPVSG
jgi:hypothetical protein